MYIKLFLANMPKSDYGDFPIEPSNDSKKIKYYGLTKEEAVCLNSISEKINNACESLIGLYDTDYLDYIKCKKLLSWIEENINKFSDPMLVGLLNILLDYCSIAINLKTGIIIEL